MRLTTVHKILIASATIFFLFFALIEVREFAAGGGLGDLASAALGVAVAIGFALYFRTIKPLP